MIINDVTIVGLGAIGSVYAVALQDSAINVRVALDAERLNRYRSEGLMFNDKRYDFDYYTPSASDAKAQLIIIATKSSGLEEALDLINPVVGEQTQILPLLNGITSEKICAARYGWHRVLYGYFIGHTATRYGNEVHQDGRYRTYFGEAINGEVLSQRVADVCVLFDKAFIPYKVPADMEVALWQKYIINIGMNQATAVLQCTYGHLQKSEAAKQYMYKLMEEAAQVAQAAGIEGGMAMVNKAMSLLDTLSPQDGSSMYQDVRSGRVTEVDLFADTVCRLGKTLGITTPYNFHAGVIIKALR